MKLNQRGRERKREQQVEDRLKAAEEDAELEAIMMVAKRTQDRIDAARDKQTTTKRHSSYVEVILRQAFWSYLMFVRHTSVVNSLAILRVYKN